MKIIFPGTRGQIQPRSQKHRRHSCLLIVVQKGRILIDFGKDWEGKWEDLSPDTLLLSHAHSDHVGGLTTDPGCEVYASAETWSRIPKSPVAKRKTIWPDRALTIHGLRFQPFAVQHSINAPALAFRIGTGEATCFYASDVLKIPEAGHALKGVRLYIGDGASPNRPIVRQQDNTETGHASIRQQLEWCAAAEVPHAIFTHCGSELVSDSAGKLAEEVCSMGKKMGVETRIAHDGMEITLPKQ